MSEPPKYTFHGRTVAEAMQKVTAALGHDAFILERRRIQRGGLLKGLLGGEEIVEILASPEAPPPPSPPPASTPLLSRTYGVASEEAHTHPSPSGRSVEASRGRGEKRDLVASSPPPACQETTTRSSRANIDPLAEDERRAMTEDLLAGVRAEIFRLMATHARGGLPAVSETLLEMYYRLVENDVAADLARRLVEKLQRELPGAALLDPTMIGEAMRQAIARILPSAGPIRLREDGATVVALVGPTGVGKTTTIVKLAFEFHVRKGKSVALITEDARRPGAEAQLRSLAQILSLPLVMADTPVRVAEEIRRLRGRDLILIDTAGRSPRDTKSLAELAAFLEAVHPDEVHLVLSSESALSSALEGLERFRAVRFNRIVWSKLDEAASYGLILNVAERVAEGFSYLTLGQQSPDSIRPSDGESLASLVMGLTRIEEFGAEVLQEASPSSSPSRTPFVS